MSGSRDPLRPKKQAPRPRNPGDEARPGSEQSGDQICPTCGGTGRIENSACADCGGTGRVTVIVGDA
jgi:DnaJ-class molecular chaperone